MVGHLRLLNWSWILDVMLLGVPIKCLIIVKTRELTPSGIPIPILSSKMGLPSSSFLIECLIRSLDSLVRCFSHQDFNFPEKPVTINQLFQGDLIDD